MSKEWGISIGESAVAIDMSQVQERKDRIVGGLTKGVEFLFKKNKIDWIKGTARLTGQGGVEVFEGDVQTLAARKEIIVATGSAPRSVPGIEIDRTRIITSDEAIHLKQVPKIDRDSRQRRRRRGVRVDLPAVRQRGDHCRAAAAARAGRRRSRIGGAREVVPQAGHQDSHRREGDGATVNGAGVDVSAQLADGTATTIDAEYLLVATGRGPVTTGLDAEGVGLQIEKGYIKVDELFRTSVPGISAIGDVITLGTPGHPQLAHVSSAEGIIAAERIAGQDVRPINYDHVPGCTYCDPEIGSVGLTEREAKERGFDVRVGMFPFGVLGRAKMSGETEGFVKIVADKASRRRARLSHDRLALDRARRRSDAGAASAVDRRRSDSHHPRASDHGRGRG